MTDPQPAPALPDAPPSGPTTLLVLAKEPVPGRVKTRLTPPFTPEQAAVLARAALVDTLRTALAVPARRRVLVLEGEPGRWPGIPAPRSEHTASRPLFDVVPQSEGRLDERIAAAFASCTGPTLLIGMDTPQLTAPLLAPALSDDAWRQHDAWFGPALDGGFWALGLARPDPALLLGVPMSTPHTGAEQLRRLAESELRTGRLPLLRDVDTAADARFVATQSPHSRFARTLARLNTRQGTAR
ncbi:TIGR04282 family arsenosugar biosynthesis glycosyltransferase [Streptomyces sulphureus]|uniref:TIGR04282 family arsenosugar biosynthesis glycosyltransferase n=1 Tax=Streptomyces sulphureus TaxID=47758 RepID=UPI000369F26E|nr:DUF2064 domain-containing protein [Streptomyces sulphureus]